MKNNLFKILIIATVMGVSSAVFAKPPEAVTEPQNTELMSAIIKFATVMGAVMLSSFIIYLVLAVWNAFVKRSRSKTTDYDATLKSPQSIDEAILLFIQKNRLK